MKRDELIDLYQFVMAHDKRRYDPTEVSVWAEHAQRGQWDYHEAREIVFDHYFAHDITGPNDWITPGAITARLNEKKRNGRALWQPKPFEVLTEPEPTEEEKERSRKYRQAVIAELWRPVRAKQQERQKPTPEPHEIRKTGDNEYEQRILGSDCDSVLPVRGGD